MARLARTLTNGFLLQSPSAFSPTARASLLRFAVFPCLFRDVSNEHVVQVIEYTSFQSDKPASDFWAEKRQAAL